MPNYEFGVDTYLPILKVVLTAETLFVYSGACHACGYSHRLSLRILDQKKILN